MKQKSSKIVCDLMDIYINIFKLSVLFAINVRKKLSYHRHRNLNFRFWGVLAYSSGLFIDFSRALFLGLFKTNFMYLGNPELTNNTRTLISSDDFCPVVYSGMNHFEVM